MNPLAPEALDRVEDWFEAHPRATQVVAGLALTSPVSVPTLLWLGHLIINL